MKDTPLQPGDRLGNYILLEVVGEGGFARVWKASHHERPGRVVALKVAIDDAFRRQLSREGRLPDINHPNVVPILDADTKFSDHPYVVTPFYAGGSLADIIAKHQTGLPEDMVDDLLKDILSGVRAAHDQGIVHRDIKPANVLIDEAGRALVADFGLSLTDDGPNQRRSMIQSGSLSGESGHAIAGTLPYLAPEVLQGTDASKTSDVYSLGVLLFEMLTGRRPAGLELPSRSRVELSHKARWDAIYYWASQHPAERYTDAGAMFDALRDGPRPLLFADQATPEPSPIRPYEAPQLSGDAWEDLTAIWDKYEAVHSALSAHRAKISKTLALYVESHAEVRPLRVREATLVSELEVAESRLRAHGELLAQEMKTNSERLLGEMNELRAQGLQKTHPSVVKLSETIDQLEGLRRDVLGLSADHPNAVNKCMTAYRTARTVGNAGAYQDFILDYGWSTLSNPWAAHARERLRAYREGKPLLRLAVAILLTVLASVSLALGECAFILAAAVAVTAWLAVVVRFFGIGRCPNCRRPYAGTMIGIRSGSVRSHWGKDKWGDSEVTSYSSPEFSLYECDFCAHRWPKKRMLYDSKEHKVMVRTRGCQDGLV